MQVNNNELLKYTLRKNIQAAVQSVACTNMAQPIQPREILEKNEIDTVNINGENIDISGVMSDEEYYKAQNALKNRRLASSELVTQLTIEDIKSANYQNEITNIKNAVYDVHNGGGAHINPIQDFSGYSTFLEETSFKGADELVSWLKGANSWDNEKGGLPVSKLVELTQNDSLEDANKDFFGLLNRAFNNHVDSQGNIYTVSSLNFDDDATIISYKELKNFFKNIETYTQYLDKVQSYSDELQNEYAALDNQGKLDFAIAKTREYLEAAGMQDQIDALDRLLNMEDFHSDKTMAVRGNITLLDLNNGDISKGMTCGAYNYIAYFEQYTGQDGTVYDIKDWMEDTDSSENDLGIALDYRIAEGTDGYNFGNWYDLVDTLVHELTHATAYKYYYWNYDDDGNPTTYGITDEGVERLRALGAFDGKDEDSLSFEDYEYLAYTAWGEYYAYQKDADYLDSIGQDILYNKDYEPGMAVDGDKEKDTIDKHIKDLYNNNNNTEAVPDWKWWSYA